MRLAVLPARLALLEEGADPLLCIRGQRVHRHDRLREIVGPVFVELDLPVEGLLADSDRQAARARNPVDEPRDSLVQLAARDDAVDEPPLERRRRIDEVTGEEHLERTLSSD